MRRSAAALLLLAACACEAYSPQPAAVELAGALTPVPSPAAETAAEMATQAGKALFKASAAPSAANNNGNLVFPEGKLLPSVQCIEYIALVGSQTLPLFRQQMQALGFWNRVTLHPQRVDSEGKAAGVFRAHVNAWKSAVARGCHSALILEEDTFFNEPVVEQSMAHADNFLASGEPYDMLFLSYSTEHQSKEHFLRPLKDPQYMLTKWEPYAQNSYDCVYVLHRWLTTGAYVISRPTMERWSNLTYVANQTLPIDAYLANHVRAREARVNDPTIVGRRRQGACNHSGVTETGSMGRKEGLGGGGWGGAKATRGGGGRASEQG